MRYTKTVLLVLFIALIIGCNKDEPNATESNNPSKSNPDKINTNSGNEAPVNPKNEVPKHTLKLKMNLGEKRLHEVFNVTRISKNVDGTEKASKYINVIKYKETPTRRIDDDIILNISYQSFEKAIINSDGLKDILVKTDDTENKYDENQTKVYNAVVETPLNIHVNPRSKILSIEGIQNIITAALINFLGESYNSSPYLKQLSEILNKNFNEPVLEQAFHEGLFILPENPVLIGDKWEDEIVVGFKDVGNIAFKITLTLAGVKKVDEELIAIIKLDGVYDEESKANSIADSYGITESKYNGEIEFNITTGSFGDLSRKIDVSVSQITENEDILKIQYTVGKEEKISVIK